MGITGVFGRIIVPILTAGPFHRSQTDQSDVLTPKSSTTTVTRNQLKYDSSIIARKNLRLAKSRVLFRRGV